MRISIQQEDVKDFEKKQAKLVAATAILFTSIPKYSARPLALQHDRPPVHARPQEQATLHPSRTAKILFNRNN